MPDEKTQALYWRQKELLDTFLATHAITRQQYEKSLGDLTRKMGMEPLTAAASGEKQA